jgi:hypothetical protein
VPPVPVLTGFLDDHDRAHGRPVWVSFAHDGALLVSDDVGGVVWRVTAPGAKPAAGIAAIPSHEAPPPPNLPGHFTMKRDDTSDINAPQP